MLWLNTAQISALQAQLQVAEEALRTQQQLHTDRVTAVQTQIDTLQGTQMKCS